MNLIKILDAQTCYISQTQAKHLELLCGWLRQVVQNGTPPDPLVVVNGLNAVAVVNQQAPQGESAPGWKAAHQPQLFTNSGLLVLNGPGGDELVFHLDAAGRPFTATWCDVPGGLSENAVSFSIKAQGTGWTLELESLDSEQRYNFCEIGGPIWGQKPARQNLEQTHSPTAAEENRAAQCPQCGAPLSPGKNFCGKCGAAVPQIAAQPSAAVCTRCGAPLTPGKKFCGKCGAAAPQTSKQPPPLDPQTNFCSRCGAALNPGKKFCGSCGQQIY
jgi:uncharacterized OB-fold protein